MSLNKFVGTHPAKKILPAVPKRENDIRLAIVHRAQHVIRNKSRHLVNQAGAVAKPLLKRVGIFRLDVNTIGDRYHASSSLLTHFTHPTTVSFASALAARVAL